MAFARQTISRCSKVLEAQALTVYVPQSHGICDVISSSVQNALSPSNNCDRVMLAQSVQHLCALGTYATVCESALHVSVSPSPAIGVCVASCTDVSQQLLPRQVVAVRVISLLQP